MFPPWDKSSATSPFSTMNAVFELEGKIISKSTQSEIFAHQIDGKTYFVKRYFRSKGFGSWIGSSRLQVEARNQRWFNKMNLPSAQVVAYGEERFLLKTKKGALITEGIENVTDLAAIAKNNPSQFQNAAWRKALTLKVATMLRTLHDNKFCHNDMHWRNVLVQENDIKSELKIYLIDCPSGEHLFWPFLNYKKLKDLANIDKRAPHYLSRTQRLRFFFEYRQISKLAPKDKAMIRDILTHKASRLKRKARQSKY